MAIKLCIDPGHGMGNITSKYDPGAVGGGVAEADVALQWALALKHVGITEFGVKPEQIVLTRDDASDVTPVGRRDDVALQNGCTHLLSIHCNAASPLASGTETLYSEDKGKERSIAFAKLVQKCAVMAVGGKDRGIKSERVTRHKDLSVFGMADRIDSCLLETGFISNYLERQQLLSRDVRMSFARNFWTAMGFTRRAA